MSAAATAAQHRYPVVGSQVDMTKGWSCGQHSQKCALKNGLGSLSYSEDPKDDDSNDNDKKPAAVEKTYTNIRQEMKTKTAELATSKLTTTPESIWGDVVSWANYTVVRNQGTTSDGSCQEEPQEIGIRECNQHY